MLIKLNSTVIRFNYPTYWDKDIWIGQAVAESFDRSIFSIVMYYLNWHCRSGVGAVGS